MIARQLFVDFRTKIPGAPVIDLRSEHREYLTKLKNEGKLLLAGPLVDGSLGLLIFTTNSLEEALALSNDDPMVIRGINKPNIKQWRVNIY